MHFLMHSAFSGMCGGGGHVAGHTCLTTHTHTNVFCIKTYSPEHLRSDPLAAWWILAPVTLGVMSLVHVTPCASPVQLDRYVLHNPAYAYSQVYANQSSSHGDEQ